MKLIQDFDKLSAYAARHGIDAVFSCWHRLQKELVFYEKNEYLAHLGDSIQALYFLVDGTLGLTAPEENGNELAITVFEDYALVGEIEYLLRLPCASHIQARTNVLCIRIPIPPNRSLLAEDLHFYHYLSITLAQRMTTVNNISIQKSSSSLEQRLAQYLLCHYTAPVRPISGLKALCPILHCSYRQLLRIFKKFCSNGCLTHGEARGIYVIKDTAALQKLS